MLRVAVRVNHRGQRCIFNPPLACARTPVSSLGPEVQGMTDSILYDLSLLVLITLHTSVCVCMCVCVYGSGIEGHKQEAFPAFS